MEKEFEEFWQINKKRLIDQAPHDLAEERRNTTRLNTAGDWLLLIFPFAAMVVFLDRQFIQHELLNFIASIAVGVAFMGIGEMIKPYVTGKRRAGDIDADIKTYYYEKYKREGKL